MGSDAPLPRRWEGVWATDDGRVFIIQRTPLTVSVLNQPDGVPFRTPAGKRSGSEPTINLAASFVQEPSGLRLIELPLGDESVPTLRLSFQLADDTGETTSGTAATISDRLGDVRCVPAVSLGMYDDPNAVGVPWLFPLHAFRLADPTTTDVARRRLRQLLADRSSAAATAPKGRARAAAPTRTSRSRKPPLR